ncbi:MAG: hypothetical protein QW506_07530 [Thermoproteota archaeon]
MPTEREWAEAFRRLDCGESSYELEAKRLGVGKSTVYRHHIGELQRRVNEAKSELSKVREELSETKQRLASLEEEYEKKRQMLERNLQIQVNELSSKLQTLEEEKRKVEDEISQAQRKLNSTLQELNRITATQERLKRIGVNKVASLTEFIECYEAFGFNAQEVQMLATWRKSLAKMGIDPNKLGEFIKQRGSLERQLANLNMEKSAREQEVKKLKDEYMRLLRDMNTLKNETLGLYTLKSGQFTLPCKFCGMQGISMNLASIKNAVMNGLGCSGMCFFCGQWSTYTSLEAAWFAAQLLLPAICST